MNPVKATPIEIRMRESLIAALGWEYLRLKEKTPSLRIKYLDTLSCLMFADEPDNPDSWVYPTLGYRIIPEKRIGPYRVDFFIAIESAHALSAVIIECDGHKWHTSSKHKVSYDRKRDRWFQSIGFPVFRFTGHEIHRCADELAVQAWAHCWTNCMEGIVNSLSPNVRRELIDDIDRLRQEDAEFVMSEKLAIES